MGIVVSLHDIVEAIDLPNAEWQSYLDTVTGEIVLVTDEDEDFLEEDEAEPEGAPAWEVEAHQKARLVNEEPDRFLPLPGSFEVHEWEIMRRFSTSVPYSAHRDELLNAIHGPGAFRYFKATVDRLGLREEWFAFRRSQFEELARDWLDGHSIAYVEKPV